ncbi:MAG: family 78 glycoside hydrolase catalytic domain, partial [Candidatus Hydrogenedentes bacterium]|nr:family 78 glycoside hydrolase catalytic domain [Candidatus Hydrogenedentota bacterium]
DDGTWFYDFGTEIVGHTRIQIKGETGKVITVRHGEELLEDGRVRFKIRANMTYEEKPILSGGDDHIAFYDYRAFRYMEILDAPEKPEVWVEVRHHPFDAGASALVSDDDSLEQIFSICKNGVQMASQGGFLDCPTREKGQYLGDAVITGRSHLWLTGDGSLTKKALYDFYLSCQIDPGMMAVAPGHFMQEIAEYPLQYPFLLEAYYQHTGDRAFLEAMVDHVFPGLFAYYADFENEAGLVEGLDKPDKWLLVDWPDNLRDGYDYEYSRDKANTVLNGFYYGALRSAARLEMILGRDGDAYAARAERVSQAFAKHLANPETGLYVDAPGSKHSSLHANAIPLAFGLTAGADQKKMLALIKDKGLSCGVYIASYVIEACFRAGDPDLGYALLTNDSEHSWKEMLRAGATTCMEAWGPDQKWNTSWCHPWSSSPIYIIAEHVLGLSPGTPGWDTVRFAPPAIKNLPAMTLTVPHPKGPMTVSYDPAKGYHLTVPDGVAVDIQAPEGVVVTSNNTQTNTNQGGPALSDTAMDYLKKQGWQEKVGDGRGVWIDVKQQRFYIIENGAVQWDFPCATAAAGTGSVNGSLQTPLGWHTVAEKFGADAPWGQVFRSRQATKEIWKPGDDVSEDLVLTRVLWLDGMEPGKNQGKTPDGTLVDSKIRCIYIHGTNGEKQIGTPSSHGCIRLLNDDVIEIFDKLPVGTPVLITESRD